MDPNGGTNPSNPQLDPNQVPQQDITAPVAPVAPEFSSELPPEMPPTAPTFQEPAPMAGAPVFDDSTQTSTPMPAMMPMDPDPMLQQPMQAPKQGGKGKKVLVILLLVLVGLGLLAGAGFAGYTAGKSAGKKEAQAEFQQQALEQQQLNDQEEAPVIEATLDISVLIDPEYKDETLEGEVGEQVTASDGMVILVNNIERNFKVEDPNYKLEDGMELVKVNFVMGNKAKDKPKDVDAFDFRLEDGDKKQLTPENIADYQGKFDTVKLDPGSQKAGSVVFAVKKDAKPLTFVREQRYRITNQNREVTSRIEIVVAE